MAEIESINIALITANVGSLFEDPTQLLKPWLQEFLKKIGDIRPSFVALHLQEVGGKTYDKSMEYVQQFIQCLCEAEEMRDFTVVRIYMDEDFNSAEHFTALGNMYFVHKNLTDLKIWNFLTHEWENASDKSIYSGNIECVPTKEKSKFPQHFFPECKWSRKGFMRTRWQVNGTVFDLVNIHLFHDASNLAACEEFPSVYCKTRRRALVHTLERFHLDDKNGFAPYFVFGDFNFRCDTEGVIKELTQNLTVHRMQSFKSDSTKLHYRNSVGDNVLTVGKKEFNHADHQLKFKEAWLKKHDRELEALDEVLVEYPIDFPPSYPFEEDPEMPTDYMSTRCPSWCDRILMSPQAKLIISENTVDKPYSIIGENICMGDHKPIYLSVNLKINQGTYRCCKCYLSAHNNNINNSRESALIHKSLAVSNGKICPYNCVSYNEILEECKILNSRQCLSHKENTISSQPEIIIEQEGHIMPTQAKYPSVSINIIDSDNICVCMCAQIRANANDNKKEDIENYGSNDDDGVDGTICAECRNIIRRQPVEFRYRLVSRRLMLSDEIIVNRIDTQYLNTLHQQRQQDPYTPESVESHSPNPELSSSATTTTSSNSRSPYEKHRSIDQTEEQQSNDECKTFHGKLDYHKSDNKKVLSNRALRKSGVSCSESQTQRGIVLPGQLKSRLEDLQRSSIQDLKSADDDIDNLKAHCLNASHSVENIHATSNVDVGIVVAVNDDTDVNVTDTCQQPKAVITNKQSRITYSKQVPESLSRLIKEILGNENDDIWREQSSYVEDANAPENPTLIAKSHYVQVKPLIVSEPNCGQSDENSGGDGEISAIVGDITDGGGGGGGGLFQVTASQPTEFSILKETTV